HKENHNENRSKKVKADCPFRFFPNLTSLSLRSLEVSHFACCLLNLRHVKRLELFHIYKFNKLSSHLFCKLDSLEELYFVGCELRSIEANAFAGLASLRRLGLLEYDTTELEMIGKSTLCNLVKLEELIMCNIRVKRIEARDEFNRFENECRIKV